MKITIKNIIKENKDIDPKQKYVNGIIKIINPPYFYNLRVTETPEYLWNRILSKKLNQEVTYSDNSISDSYGNLIYRETSDGFWSKQEYDSNNNIIYFEDSNGYWRKQEYDSYGNLIYREYSDGFWIKQEYDSNNNLIYFENPYGTIIDKRSSNSINENKDIDPKQRFVNKISEILNPPYFRFLRVNEIPKDMWEDILSKVFNQKVIIDNNIIDNENNNIIYYENSNGYWMKQEFDSNNNKIYYEDSKGYWIKRGYDENNSIIYYENSNGVIRDKRTNNINENIDPKQRYINGILNMIRIPYFNFLRVNEVPEELWNEILSKLFNQKVKYENRYPYPFRIFDSNNNEIYIEESYGDWEKHEYDSYGNLIYRETSDGFWSKQEYDSNGNIIYYENSNGDWEKHEYDSNGNLIYRETSNGFWRKQEYDSYGNLIYRETSNGDIMDKRTNNINENIDPKQRYINGIINILKPPYFNFLRVNEVPKYLWYRILSKVFNQEVEVLRNGKIYDSNNNLIYRETSDGFWSKQEYDSNNNIIYYEDSKGYWFKQEYDSNNNEIYFENSDGFWRKQEYDSNNNLIYRETSNGYWLKREYNSNNNIIYFEDSDGVIRDNRSSNTINENIDPKQRYINGIVNMIKPPYFYKLMSFDVPEDMWEGILSNIFNQEVIIDNNVIYDSNSNNIIYSEDSGGYWEKFEYDSYGNIIYYEKSGGYWEKFEYDSNNNIIYSEDSDGFWSKREYNSNNNIIYFETSNGYWLKREYDSNNNLIYFEDSNGYWRKQEYDSNNNEIYYEDSNGVIRDNR